MGAASMVVDLGDAVPQICTDWAMQNTGLEQIQVHTPEHQATVRFDVEHLRRVMVNLLDNAKRHASGGRESIQIVCSTAAEDQTPEVAVWSDGAPLDQSVQRHLFEPFFSSESRSSGLGLFISRELCSQYGASINYRRCERLVQGQRVAGNAFVISFLNDKSHAPLSGPTQKSTPWQTTLH
jgi:two-component system sensor histidine kinase PilS (NtrC family)